MIALAADSTTWPDVAIFFILFTFLAFLMWLCFRGL